MSIVWMTEAPSQVPWLIAKLGQAWVQRLAKKAIRVQVHWLVNFVPCKSSPWTCSKVRLGSSPRICPPRPVGHKSLNLLTFMLQAESFDSPRIQDRLKFEDLPRSPIEHKCFDLPTLVLQAESLDSPWNQTKLKSIILSFVIATITHHLITFEPDQVLSEIFPRNQTKVYSFP